MSEEEYQQDKRRQPKSGGISTIIAAALFISVVTSVLSILIYDRYFAVKIVTVDLKGYVSEQRELYVRGKITEDEFKRSIDNLEAVIGNVPKKTVVLTSDVVVRNAKTITE